MPAKRTLALAIGAGLLLAGAAHAAPAAEPTKKEAKPSDIPPPEAMSLSREIIEIIFPTDKRDEMIVSLARTMATQSAAGEIEKIDDPNVRKIVEDHMGGMLERMQPLLVEQIPKQMDAVALAYAKRFSVAELGEILAFAKTPAGSHYFRSSAALMEDPAITAANQALFLKIHEFVPAEQAALRDKIILYFEQREALQSGDASAL